MSLRTAQEAARQASEKKLAAHLDRACKAILAALKKQGIKIERKPHGGYSRTLDIPGVRHCFVEAFGRTINSFSYSGNVVSGDEPLMVKVGDFGSWTIIKSTKEDPDLTGVRVAKIVDEILTEIRVQKSRIDDQAKRHKTREASRKIVRRLTRYGESKNSLLQFDMDENDATMVRVSLSRTSVTEDVAKTMINALDFELLHGARGEDDDG